MEWLSVLDMSGAGVRSVGAFSVEFCQERPTPTVVLYWAVAFMIGRRVIAATLPASFETLDPRP